MELLRLIDDYMQHINGCSTCFEQVINAPEDGSKDEEIATTLLCETGKRMDKELQDAKSEVK